MAIIVRDDSPGTRRLATYLNGLKRIQAYVAVEAEIGDFVHIDADERVIATATPTDLPTAIVSVKAMIVSYGAHRTDKLHHDNEDTTNTVASVVADVVDLATAITAANQLKAAFNAHRSQANVHLTADAGNAIAATNASDLVTLIVLLTEMKTDINGHFNASSIDEPASWRVIPV